MGDNAGHGFDRFLILLGHEAYGQQKQQDEESG
jgi:hypothetical protein